MKMKTINVGVMATIVGVASASAVHAQSVENHAIRDTFIILVIVGLLGLFLFAIRLLIKGDAAVVVAAGVIRAKRKIAQSWNEFARRARERAGR